MSAWGAAEQANRAPSAALPPHACSPPAACRRSGTISDTVAGLDWVAANYRKPAVVTLSLGIQASKHAPEAEAEAELSCLRAPRQQSSSSADWPLLLSPLPLPAGGQLVAGAGGRRPLAHHQAGHHGALRLLRLLCLLLHAAAPCMRRASLCPLTSLASSSPPPSLPRWWWPAATAASTPATWRRVRAVSSELANRSCSGAGGSGRRSPAAVQLPTLARRRPTSHPS